MRVIAVLAAMLLLSSCTWVRQELSPAPPPPAPKPANVNPHRPSPYHEKPAPVHAVAPAPPALDFNVRCHEMANNRADDAKQLGASAADQAKMQSDTYRDCMAQSVKPSP